MKQSFVPLFMRYSKVPPRPNKQVIYDDSPTVEEQSLDYKGYPETDVSEHQHYYPTDDCSENKDCMPKPGGNKDMMPMCPLAKAFVCWQVYGKVFNPKEAFRKGTIFPELHHEYLR